jgi:hypothetical protein
MGRFLTPVKAVTNETSTVLAFDITFTPQTKIGFAPIALIN